MTTVDSFGSKGVLDVKGAEYEIFRLNKVEGAQKLPYSLKVLLENLLRTEDGADITADDIKALAQPVLAHRLLVRPEAQLQGITSSDALAEILNSVPVPAGAVS